MSPGAVAADARRTTGFEAFSEAVFQCRITPWLAGKGLIFAMMVGLLGSILPPLRAARLPVIASLKAI